MDQDASPTFAIILKTIREDSGNLDPLSRRFSEAFHIAEERARELLDLSPVALFSGLSRGQVSDVKPPLKSLSEEFEVQFLITSSSVSSMPKLSWSEYPDLERADEDTVFEVEIEEQDESLVCPKCEHVLVLDQSGDRVSGSVLTQTDDSESGEDSEVDTDLSDLEDSDLEDIVQEEEEDTSAEDAEIGEDTEEETKEQQEQQQTTTASGNTNVFISGMPDADTDEVVDLLAKVRNCSPSEAEDLMDRPITPIMNGVTDEKASELKEQFNEIGVNVNIVSK